MNQIAIEAQGERAVFVPDLGFQCLGYQVGTQTVIAGHVDEAALLGRPFGAGNAILFPWPGRVAGGSFDWAGREVRLPVNEVVRGHALHGLTYKHEFRVVRRGPYYLVAELDSRLVPELKQAWPWDFILRIDCEIGNGLRYRATVENVGAYPMPFGFGLHPYFPAPFTKAGNRSEVKVKLPTRQIWQLGDNLIPPGPREAAAGRFDFVKGRELGEHTYDDAFSDPIRDSDEICSATLADPKAGLKIEVSASADFGEWLLYAPPARQVVAIEPYTCAPNAFQMSRRGIDCGVRELAPGSSWEGAVQIRLSAL